VPEYTAVRGSLPASTSQTHNVSQKAVREVTGEVTGEVLKLLHTIKGEMKRAKIQQLLGLRNENHFREAYLLPALNAELIEMTIPDKPTSSNQSYRLTLRGQALLKRK
jgi:ATP-dependent DNA helicase RecG